VTARTPFRILTGPIAFLVCFGWNEGRAAFWAAEMIEVDTTFFCRRDLVPAFSANGEKGCSDFFEIDFLAAGHNWHSIAEAFSLADPALRSSPSPNRQPLSALLQ